MVHRTLREGIGIRWAYGATPEAIESAFKKLEQYGLLVPAEPVGTRAFFGLAQKFYKDNVKSSHST